jgi:hypothetical protein
MRFLVGAVKLNPVGGYLTSKSLHALLYEFQSAVQPRDSIQFCLDVAVIMARFYGPVGKENRNGEPYKSLK